MIIRIDPGSATPIFEQLVAAVRTEVFAGRLHAGERLPAARELAASLEVNPHTVLHAYQALRDDGLIELRRGRGAVVTAASAALAEVRDQAADLVAAARTRGLGADAVLALIREEFDR
ncbi:GntR family transcriptional regulator [Agromyces marinus]|uniref:GntR family transcriptional regulator n=1 Tax=Agromyces marinus TaxID=1389020 RepID=A0ABM8GZN0_9MICO|nr:GntR family transcriptional regulator [Agromyces marinus]UIP57852.1 HTH-type transcriptional repressor YtrA [Agromyces marinus]BDZ53960.1 GntR family transcriptional regulator [Agromyces marinus]